VPTFLSWQQSTVVIDIKGTQILYFQDDHFQKAASIPAPNVSDVI